MLQDLDEYYIKADGIVENIFQEKKGNFGGESLVDYVSDVLQGFELLANVRPEVDGLNYPNGLFTFPLYICLPRLTL